MMDLLQTRQKAGLSQSQLATKAGVDPRLISSFENNKQPMSMAFATKVAPALGVSAEKLYNNQGLSRIIAAQDTAIKAIKSCDELPEELSQLVDALGKYARLDSGPIGAAAKRAMIGIRNAVVTKAAEIPAIKRDAVGRVVHEKDIKRDGVGRRRDNTEIKRDGFGHVIKEEK